MQFFETIADKLSQNVNVAVQLRPFIFTIFIIIFALKEKQNMRNICIRSSLKVMSITRKEKYTISVITYLILIITFRKSHIKYANIYCNKIYIYSIKIVSYKICNPLGQRYSLIKGSCTSNEILPRAQKLLKIDLGIFCHFLFLDILTKRFTTFELGQKLFDFSFLFYHVLNLAKKHSSP